MGLRDNFRNITDKITIYEGGNVALEGHLPLFDQKLGCFHGDRDRDCTAPYFQFSFKFKLPNPRKDRIIFKRDKFGRIVSSKAPGLPEYALTYNDHREGEYPVS